MLDTFGRPQNSYAGSKSEHNEPKTTPSRRPRRKKEESLSYRQSRDKAEVRRKAECEESVLAFRTLARRVVRLRALLQQALLIGVRVLHEPLPFASPGGRRSPRSRRMQE